MFSQVLAHNSHYELPSSTPGKTVRTHVIMCVPGSSITELLETPANEEAQTPDHGSHGVYLSHTTD